MSNKSGKIKSLLLSVAVLLNAFSLSLWPAYEGHAADAATFELYSKVVGTKCTDSNDASFTRAVDPQDAGAVVVYTIRIANGGDEEYTGDITTKSLSSGMDDINGGTVKNNHDDGSTYQIRTYINQKLSVGNIPESAKISISKVAMANDVAHTYSEVSKYFVYKNPTIVQASGTVIQANINYLCGSLTLKKEQDSSGNKFPDDASFSYNVTLEGGEELLGRKVHVEGSSLEGTFTAVEGTDPVKCTLSMTIPMKVDSPVTIYGLPIGVKYTVTEAAQTNYTQTAASGLSGTIEKQNSGTNVKYTSTGSKAEASITSKYTGEGEPAEENQEEKLDEKEKAKDEETSLEKDPNVDTTAEDYGKESVVSSAEYMIISSTAVSFVKPAKDTATVKIPATVTIDGKKYKVTRIEKGAFKYNKKIKSVVIGKNVTVIAARAFYGCKNLKKITIKSSKFKKKSIGNAAFKGIHKKAVFKVPKKKLATYKKYLKSAGMPKKAKVKK